MEISVDEFFESTLDSVNVAEERVTGVAHQLGFEEEEVYHLGYAVHEAMVNAVVHGNRYSANKKIRLVIRTSEAAIEVSIEDEGEGFDFCAQADPSMSENLMNESGRGITIIRAFVDEFHAEKAQPHGTRVVLTKRLPSTSA
jgi:serine/threonine-protein kinase RsbW